MVLKKLQKFHMEGYAIFRIVVGLMFVQHGAQKLLGWFGGKAVESLASLMGVAGMIELVGGLAIALGFFSRLASIGGMAVMIGALAKVHFPQGLIPIMNKGELALLFLACFIMVAVHGNGKWSLEQALLKKEVF
ncbi:MAG TPA: DoxX family protein [Candidatus Nanoarchaeia archaeon]|nr:DoxX family protein [Candidatus Nanoarchaeia archaeon]